MKPWRQAAEAQGPECRSVTSEDYVAGPSLVNQFVNAHARGLVHETTTTPADMIIGTLGLVPTGIHVPRLVWEPDYVLYRRMRSVCVNTRV